VYGLSDVRPALRRYFEVDAEHIAIAVLDGLAQSGVRTSEDVEKAIRRYEVDPEAPDPRLA
jgi:pyruvate dehydrogenase E1 component